MYLFFVLLLVYVYSSLSRRGYLYAMRDDNVDNLEEEILIGKSEKTGKKKKLKRNWDLHKDVIVDVMEEIIRKVGSKYYLYTHDGSRVLGKHKNKSDAEAQERAIHASAGK